MIKCSFGIKNYSKYRVNPYTQGNSNQLTRTEVLRITKADFAKLLGLSRTSLKLLGYFIEYKHSESDAIYFDLKHSTKAIGFKNKRSVYNALIELLGEGIIARTESENLYFLNRTIIASSG